MVTSYWRTLVLPAVALLLAAAKVVLSAEYYGEKDSYKYYGPNGLWKQWDDEQRLGRDTWIFWTRGNQKFLRSGARLAGNLPAPISLDLFRALDSRERPSRFKRLGLINEPNFRRAETPDRYGL